MALRHMTAGDSHGPGLLGILEGMPAGLELSEELLLPQLQRRQAGYGSGGRMKIEKDRARIMAGVYEGRSTGAPIGLLIENLDFANWQNHQPPLYTVPRPGHADLAGAVKYGLDQTRPISERASARETAMRVAIGAIARLLLEQAGKAFTQERFDQALKFLVEGESIASGETSLQQPIGNSREEYGRTLYSMGLRVYRDDINRAIGYWEYALKFDPENEKSRLRLKSARSR